MGNDSPKCTCQFCGSENGKSFKYWTALFETPLGGGRTEYTGITEYTGGICTACRWKAHRKHLIVGLILLVVSVLVVTFLPKVIPANISAVIGAVFSFVLFIGIGFTIIGLTPANGSDMLIEEAKKQNPDSKLHYLKPKT